MSEEPAFFSSFQKDKPIQDMYSFGAKKNFILLLFLKTAVLLNISVGTMIPEKTDEFLLARFKGNGVRYKAKLIGVDDVPEARGDKMSQDSMMKLKGKAVAARSQGKHKQRVWVNISLSGITVTDEKTGVRSSHLL
uniref:PID domain-containing protein n=1 Tax=Cyprinus carpio TaxID=7962 RepID=A0A8C1KU01_CYPCA